MRACVRDYSELILRLFVFTLACFGLPDMHCTARRNSAQPGHTRQDTIRQDRQRGWEPGWKNRVGKKTKLKKPPKRRHSRVMRGDPSGPIGRSAGGSGSSGLRAAVE